jgi:CDP-6-deoxy-D-xylo-4-hexulose-3-dehydrase
MNSDTGILTKVFKEVDIAYKKKIIKSNKKKYHTLSDANFDEIEMKSLIKNFFFKNLSQGQNVKNFEKIFAKKIGTKYAIAVNSGSSANLLSLQALINIYNLKKNDEVIIPASTFATVAMPIIQLGLIPVYCDVELENLNLSISEIKKAIRNKTKIIMPVHTLGMPANMKEIKKIAQKNNLLILEDCCEAHGSSIDKKKTGSWGDVSAFSFFVAHNITTIEGGMILTNNKKIYEECVSLREFGRIDQSNISRNRYFSSEKLKNYDKRYVFTKIGYNMRMTDLQGGLGYLQTKKMHSLNKKRIQNAKFLRNLILRKLNNFINVIEQKKNYVNTYYTFPILLKKNIKKTRKEICNFLEKYNIQTRPMMAGCLPDQPFFKNTKGRIVGSLKNSRFVRDNCFFVGIHPGINRGHLEKFVDLLKSYLNG